MTTEIIRLRDKEGGDTGVTASSTDLPEPPSFAGGLLEVGRDTYVYDVRTGQWRLPTFTATGKKDD